MCVLGERERRRERVRDYIDVRCVWGGGSEPTDSLGLEELNFVWELGEMRERDV